VNSPLIFTVDGPEWDITSCIEFSQAIAPAIDYPNVVIDLSAVEFIDSSCVAKLIALYKERVVKQGFGPSRLVVSSANVKRIFEIAELGSLWQISETLEEALEAP
jgi:anti-sigma B factor antagonist